MPPCHPGTAAAFHTHLDALAAPTPADIDRLLAAPQQPIIIVSLQELDEPDIRAWTLHAGRPHELPLGLATKPLHRPLLEPRRRRDI